eukprot:gene6466-10472_t
MYGQKLKQILEKSSLDKSPAVIKFWNSYNHLKEISQEEEENIFQLYSTLFEFIKKRNSFLSKEMIKLYLIFWLITFDIVENKNFTQTLKEKYLNNSKIETKLFLDKFKKNSMSKYLKYFISTTGNINSIVQNSIFNFILSLISMSFLKRKRLIFGGIIFFLLNKITSVTSFIIPKF